VIGDWGQALSLPNPCSLLTNPGSPTTSSLLFHQLCYGNAISPLTGSAGAEFSDEGVVFKAITNGVA